MKSTIIITSLIAVSAFILTGCDSPPPRTPSTAFAKFDPGQKFEMLGCTVEQSVADGRLNTRDIYGWRPFRGTIELPEDAKGCEFVANAVHDALAQVVDEPCRDELDLSPGRRPGQPYYGMLRYTNNGMQGFVYVWLFPNTAETHINYAILLHEQAPTHDARSI